MSPRTTPTQVQMYVVCMYKVQHARAGEHPRTTVLYINWPV